MISLKKNIPTKVTLRNTRNYNNYSRFNLMVIVKCIEKGDNNEPENECCKVSKSND